jgi:hypothetical protein
MRLLDSSQQQYPSGSRHIGFLSCTLFNARSLNNKLFDLHYLLCTDKPDILCKTETWLQPTLPNNLIVFDSNYSVFRDRPSGRIGSGVCTMLTSTKATAVSIPVIFLQLVRH